MSRGDLADVVAPTDWANRLAAMPAEFLHVLFTDRAIREVSSSLKKRFGSIHCHISLLFKQLAADSLFCLFRIIHPPIVSVLAVLPFSGQAVGDPLATILSMARL